MEKIQKQKERIIRWTKRLSLLSGLIILGVLFFQSSRIALPPVQFERLIAPKKKIVLFSSVGGSGHTAAAASITKLLGDRYVIKTVNIYDELIGYLDPIRQWTGGKMTGEGLYNKMLSEGYIRTESFLVYFFGPLMFTLYTKAIQKKIYEFLVKEKPDMLISLVPYGNYEMSKASEACGIPFMLTTTDNDLSNWQQGLGRIKRDDFSITIGFDLPTTRTLLERKGVRTEQIRTIGLPVREQFLMKKEYHDLKRKWSIPRDKFAILLMMGGAGSLMCLRYAKQLLKCKLPLHVMICVGRSEELKQKIEALRKPGQHVTFTTVGYTQDVDELMRASDLLITKPGPGTLVEAMHMRLPMVLDNTGPQLYWEQANLRLVKRHSLGLTLDRFNNLEKLLTPFVMDKKYYASYKNRLDEFAVQDYRKSFTELVETLINRK